MSLADNALLTAHRQGYVKRGLIRFAEVDEFAGRCIKDYDVKCGGTQAEAKSLSGGNLQKFIVGREIMQVPKVLVVAQPTWGVDVGAAAFIRQKIIDLRNDGVAILVLSEELDELFEISDRIAVIAKGRLSPAKPIKETNVEEIGVWMSGMWPDSGDEAHFSPAHEEARRAAQA
jgi:simple sugar transport system ATP-binding protein